MHPNKTSSMRVVLAAFLISAACHLPALGMPAENAWKALPSYEYGQGLAPLLAIDREIISAMASPKQRSACAARLASLLTLDDTTPAARQMICLRLGQVGTSAEVPLLARLLAKPETSEMACGALETIPGVESLAALRGALASLQEDQLVGVVNSLGARGDVLAVANIEPLTDSTNKLVAAAALRALGNIADDRATAFLSTRAKTAMSQDLAIALLRCSKRHIQTGNTEAAKEILEKLRHADQPKGVRLATKEGLFRLQGELAEALIPEWLASRDADQRRIALSHLDSLSDERLDKLLARLTDLPETVQPVLLERAISRRGKRSLPIVIAMAQSDKPELRLAGIRGLGMLGDASTTPLLIDMLSTDRALVSAVQDALIKLPGNEVDDLLLEAMQTRSTVRIPIIAVLNQRNCYAAIDPLIEIAAQSDPKIYRPALKGLRGIARPDLTDISRLVKLLLRSESGKHRDEVEKTILLVCNKMPAERDRSELVHAALASTDLSKSPQVLSLLGRLGGAKALETIQAAIQNDDPQIQEAGVRGLCNWPNAEVDGQLLELATNLENKRHRRWALRAYIRVVTLRSDRPEANTLSMLQNVMKITEHDEDRQLVLERASIIRTMETVDWLAPYLEDPKLAQAACHSIVELAHHRFLRHPNIDRFSPILEKVGQISTDPSVQERAKRYRLGL